MQDFTENYYDLFGVPALFEVDLDALTARYRQLQTEVHPDRFANASEAERLRAVQLSSHLNEAFATLQSPLRRAAYLLTLQGLDVEQVSQEDLGMELLLQQMRLREALDELPKDQSSLPDLEQLKATVTGKLTRSHESFARDLDAGSLDSARKTYHEMQFLYKLLSEIEAGEELRLGY